MLRVYIIEQDGRDIAVRSSAKKAVEYVRTDLDPTVTTDDLISAVVLRVKKSSSCNLTEGIRIKRFVME